MELTAMKSIDLLDTEVGHLYTGYQLYASVAGTVVIDASAGMASPDTAMTSDTPCYWSSATKPTIGVVLGQLWEWDRLSLSSTLAELLPDQSFANPEIGALTLIDAITYRVPVAPWLDPVAEAPEHDLLPRILALGPDAMQDPSRRSAYASWPWVLAGLIIERHTGVPLPEWTGRQVFTPLGMFACSLGAPPGPRAAPIGTSAVDDLRAGSPLTYLRAANAGWGPMRELARLFECLLNGGTLNGTRLLAEPTVWAVTGRIRAGYPECHGDVVDWGIGFEAESNWYQPNPSISFSPMTGRRSFGHKGHSSCVVLADRDQQLVIAMFANADAGEVDGRRVGAFFREVVASVHQDCR
jgi:CubicO group peptidase (beta-lactamase class C family)